ncbi:CIC11C00000001991 [Sungouiella intermedia]|uniref:CIC11C00000001991 n=1 Tax=Sungouiella intermedia TaxID=45354 RepID=A0A1L0BIT6_9ASCO|nr:CIC11C00000001991 [[Candida] intermedia]
MSPHGLCPPATQSTDYAYPESHPLRYTNFPTSRRGLLSDTDHESDDDDYYHNDNDSFATYSSDEINRRAVALFDFLPENDNEVALREGQVIWISYRHGQGWLVAEDPDSGENGLVPEEYVEIFYGEDNDEPKPFVPRLLQEIQGESEWEDTEDEHSLHLVDKAMGETSISEKS